MVDTPGSDAGWLPDPTRRHEHRYWDGSQWTEHVGDRGVSGSDPFDPSQVADGSAGMSGIRGEVTNALGDVGGEVTAAFQRMKASRATKREQAARPDAKAQEDSDTGRGQFGDGVTKALYEFKASRFKGGRLITPNVIRIWPDRVEEYEHHAVRKKQSNAIGFAQVAQVSMSRGLVWSDIKIESTGGHVITLHGVPKDEAGRVKQLLEDAVERRKFPQTQTITAGRDVAAQLRELVALRDEGVLTEEEFASQKARLLE